MGKNSDLHPPFLSPRLSTWTQKQDTGFTSVLDHKEGILSLLYSREHLDTKRRDYDKDYEEKFNHYA